MKKLIVTLFFIFLTSNVFGQIAGFYVPLIIKTDTVGCIAPTELGRQFFTFNNLTEESLSILQLAYPKETFSAATEEQERLLKEAIQRSFSTVSPPKSPTQIELARADKMTGNLYQAGENLQVSMLLMFGATMTATASSLFQVPELAFASFGLTIAATIVQWNIGTKLKRAAKDLSSDKDN